MREMYLFVKRFLSSPEAIGSLLPSSKQLSDCMAKKTAHQNKKPLRLLEVGAGSGAVTRPIVKKLLPHDWIDIVEIDPTFCTTLRKQFSDAPNVTIHETSILDFQEKNYDMIISSLPLNAFKADMVHAILQKYESLIKDGGYLSYYEYLGLEKIKQAMLFGKAAEDFKKAQRLKQSFAEKYAREIDHIWWNFPPARVVHCLMKQHIP